MEEQGGMMNTGTRAGITALISGELIAMMTDARWLMLGIIICVIADFRFGWGESSKRYALAKQKGNEILMSHYKWRTSRAIRRSTNKLIDYFIWIALGMFIGISVLSPLGIDYIFGGVAVTIVAIGCELKSIIGHFMYLHGVTIQQKTIKGFLKGFAIAFARRKNKDVAEALEESFKEMDKEEKKQEREKTNNGSK